MREELINEQSRVKPITLSWPLACGFYRWTGDVPVGQEHSETLEFVSDAPRNLTAHFGKAWFVAIDGDDANSGESPEDAFAHPQTAVSAASDGDAIIVADGVYGNSSNSYDNAIVTIDKNIMLRSLNGADATGIDSGSDSGRIVRRCRTI